jgi:hypothetical protein
MYFDRYLGPRCTSHAGTRDLGSMVLCILTLCSTRRQQVGQERQPSLGSVFQSSQAGSDGPPGLGLLQSASGQGLMQKGLDFFSTMAGEGAERPRSSSRGR